MEVMMFRAGQKIAVIGIAQDHGDMPPYPYAEDGVIVRAPRGWRVPLGSQVVRFADGIMIITRESQIIPR